MQTLHSEKKIDNFPDYSKILEKGPLPDVLNQIILSYSHPGYSFFYELQKKPQQISPEQISPESPELVHEHALEFLENNDKQNLIKILSNYNNRNYIYTDEFYSEVLNRGLGDRFFRCKENPRTVNCDIVISGPGSVNFRDIEIFPDDKEKMAISALLGNNSKQLTVAFIINALIRSGPRSGLIRKLLRILKEKDLQYKVYYIIEAIKIMYRYDLPDLRWEKDMYLKNGLIESVEYEDLENAKKFEQLLSRTAEMLDEIKYALTIAKLKKNPELINYLESVIREREKDYSVPRTED